MASRADVAAAITALVAELRSDDRDVRPITEETRLDSEDLGLDSIEAAEILLTCEDRFGVRVDPLLDGRPLTIRRVVDHFARA